MVKKSYSPEQVINKLREAEILLNQGAASICHSIRGLMVVPPMEMCGNIDGSCDIILGSEG